MRKMKTTKKLNGKVLVTGVSGYIGQHCAVELLKNGYKVKDTCFYEHMLAFLIS